MQTLRSNYLTGPNPFGMSRPPAWWLRELALFDPQLVLVPGQKRKTFVLGRRATRSGGESLHTVRGLSQNPDTIFLHQHRLVRVCEIVEGAKWDMRIFAKLAAHDIERLGGAAEVANTLDAMDAAKASGIQKEQEDEIHTRSTAGYHAYKTRIGERLSLAKSRHGRGTVIKHPVSVHVATPSPPAPLL